MTLGTHLLFYFSLFKIYNWTRSFSVSTPYVYNFNYLSCHILYYVLHATYSVLKGIKYNLYYKEYPLKILLFFLLRKMWLLSKFAPGPLPTIEWINSCPSPWLFFIFNTSNSIISVCILVTCTKIPSCLHKCSLRLFTIFYLFRMNKS